MKITSEQKNIQDTNMTINIKRVYELPQARDGTRVLIDRLWPRGLTKEKAKVNMWFKDIAPSSTLRKWFGHDPERWSEFKKRYHKELSENSEVVAALLKKLKGGNVTIVYGAKDEEHNDAVVLKEYLEEEV
jgi:uncharacterized protein YeaO (DUF488 family)